MLGGGKAWAVGLVDRSFGRKPRVLVVDDDWLSRDVVATHFTTFGAEVTAVAEAETGLALAAAEPPDLIIMDIQMPHLDGIMACQRLKTQPATQFIPVIIVTAFDSDDERIRALDAGADDFISKPFSSLLLLTRARALLKIKHLNDELSRRNALLRVALNRFVAEPVADAILTDPVRLLQLGGETRMVTVLFADLRGFTEFTDQHPAPVVVEALNRVFSALTRVVFKHRGTFDKYMGDGIMAFYGAPIAGPDDVWRAVQSGLEMQAVFDDLVRGAGHLAGLGLGVGLHSGEATVGNVGAENVMDYTVVGDVANVAKRLTEEAQPGQVLVSEATYGHVAGRVQATPLGQRVIRGRSEPVTVYTLTGTLAAEAQAVPATAET